jgi:Zn-dependent protease with chaperone function
VTSARRRAPLAAPLLAPALLGGFALAALGAAAALAWVGVRLWERAGWPSRAAAAAYLLASGAAAWIALHVRRRRFVPPGPEAREADQPGLVGLVREVAAAVGVPAPRRVHVTPDTAVFVAGAGGVLGVGTTPVLGIGLGLLSVATVSELRATLAHELGHGAAGGPRLGPLAHRVRAALAAIPARGGPLARPFEAYRTLLLRATAGPARRQELAADRAAIEVAGAAAHVAALRRAARAAVLFDGFVGSEVAPLLGRGHRPDNPWDGLRAYAEELEAQGAAGELDAAAAARPPAPDDVHPSLSDRLAHAASLADPAPPRDPRPARSLLGNPDRVEREVGALLAARLAPGAELVPVSWTEVGARVWGPALAEEGRLLASRLAGASGGAATASAALRALAGSLAAGGDEAAARVLEPGLAALPPDERRDAVGRVVGRALAVLIGEALVERGGAWRSAIGRPLEVALGGTVHAPWIIAEEALRDRDGLAQLPEGLGGPPERGE